MIDLDLGSEYEIECAEKRERLERESYVKTRHIWGCTYTTDYKVNTLEILCGLVCLQFDFKNGGCRLSIPWVSFTANRWNLEEDINKLIRTQEKRGNDNWKPWEESVLRETTTAEFHIKRRYIALFLGRSIRSVNMKARQLWIYIKTDEIRLKHRPKKYWAQ